MVLRLSVGLSLVALLVLAGLQYHWIGQITASERERLERIVTESSNEFADDFSAELRGLTSALESRSTVYFNPATVALRYREWLSGTAYPRLVKSLYVVRQSGEVLRLNLEFGEFDPASLPPELSPAVDFASRADPGAPLPLLHSDVIVMTLPRRIPERDRGFRGLNPERGPERGFGGWGDDRWRGGPPPRGFPDGGPRREYETEAWVAAELDHEVIVKQLFPALLERRFANYDGRNYRVAVVAMNREAVDHAVFASDDAWTKEDLASPDYQRDLLWQFPAFRRGGGPGGSIGGGPGGPPPPPPAPAQGPWGQGERGFRGGNDGRGGTPAFFGQNWKLLVKHRSGSVDAAARQFRQRNLAISFGVLVVLGVGAAAMVISGHRAHRLGRLQMEFAAGVSHELRTPLAVIQSAAHNLGSGIVQDREGIEQYAAIVQSEARRLNDMVEQVMAYTETQSGRRRYDLAPVDAGDLADIAIRNVASVLAECGALVQKRIDPGLPPVMADAASVARCLQNLLSNAAKYGSVDAPPRIEIEGRLAPGGSRKMELSVVDHGRGVPEADVRHLFEAFYRGSNASTNTPGNGLGLHLVRRIMEAQQGSVTYRRGSDGGAVFTITLPVATHSV